MTFKNKVVWITGASSGIGEALAYNLASKGAKLILSARSIDKLNKVKQNCKSDENHIMVLPLDLSNYEKMENSYQKAIARFKHIDYLFNNGGISQRSLATETDIEVVKKIMEVNYTGTIALTSAVLEGMLERNSGHIVVTSSVMGKFGAPMRSAYAASKHALQGYFESLRHELRDTSLAVTVVCPGFIHTDVSVNALTADGSSYEKMAPGQKNGMSPERFVQKLLKAVAKKKTEVYIGGQEILSIYLKRYTPRLLDWLIARVDTT